MKNSAIYIHIPFCDHKCIYCDFYSIITTDNIRNFINSIKKEIEYYSELYSTDRGYNSIFFGGGTPSLLRPEQIDEIINVVKKKFKIDSSAEVTLETNPGTVNGEKLKLFREAGINRLSVGIQSFIDEELKFLTRIHDKKTAIRTVEEANESGFENINVDLIFNLPKQSKKNWKYNLESAIKLPVTHISAYSLILERGTILNKMVIDGKVNLQDADYDADLYETTINFLEEKGYRQYEVSNFCKPRFECSHNNNYWRYGDYLGFGPSAHSFVENKRWWNFSSLKRYINEIEINEHAVAGSELIEKEQMLDEYVMLALRSSGINLNELKKRFGENWLKKNYDYFNKMNDERFLSMNEDSIKLTKRGYAVCDEILRTIL